MLELHHVRVCSSTGTPYLLIDMMWRMLKKTPRCCRACGGCRLRRTLQRAPAVPLSVRCPAAKVARSSCDWCVGPSFQMSSYLMSSICVQNAAA